MSDEEIEFHPIEVAAHSVLSSSLDSLQENFLNLHKSQQILLTRLKMIEDRLNKVNESTQSSISEEDLAAVHMKLSRIQQLLSRCEKSLASTEARCEQC